ncbi:unnamed protein product [Linum tenue]|uniref:TF-B3 domain-containing protein n=1 Tax=Linum tenue TaxID=586396 RepID=A0AAV0RNU7_9ROSI|nr:unnamed protein product [Linum tenue]
MVKFQNLEFVAEVGNQRSSAQFPIQQSAPSPCSPLFNHTLTRTPPSRSSSHRSQRQQRIRKMVAKQSKYEQIRLSRMEENKKRMEALNLPLLSQSLRTTSPNPSPMKQSAPRPRVVKKEVVVVRRSSRVANKPSPVYAEVGESLVPFRVVSSGRSRDLSNRVYASDEARAEALEKAENLHASLETHYPSFVKSMLISHVTGGFWLGLPKSFCKMNLPKRDEVMTLIDEEGNEHPTIYLPRKTGLSGGWKGFAVDHNLADGDALIFQLIRPTAFKVVSIFLSTPH